MLPSQTLRSLPAEERALLNLDVENPLSLYSLMPSALKAKVDHIPLEYFELDEDTLEKAAFSRSTPDKTSSRLKAAFWDEYDRVVRVKGPVMDFYRVTRGLFTPMRFYAKWTENQVRLAWLVRAPVDYEASLQELHSKGLERIRSLMESEPIDEEGNFDKPKAELQFRVYQHLDSRLKGAVVHKVEQNINQKIDQRNLTIHANANIKEAAPISQLGMQEIDQRIAELEDKSQRLLSPVGGKVRLEVGIDPGCVRKEALAIVEEQKDRRERKIN